MLALQSPIAFPSIINLPQKTDVLNNVTFAYCKKVKDPYTLLNPSENLKKNKYVN